MRLKGEERKSWDNRPVVRDRLRQPVDSRELELRETIQFIIFVIENRRQVTSGCWPKPAHWRYRRVSELFVGITVWCLTLGKRLPKTPDFSTS
jgi:hypothetical protein